MALAAFAQGTSGDLNWDNLTSGAPILDYPGSAATNNVSAELWYAPGASAPEIDLVQAAGTQILLGAPLAGYFFAGVVTLPTDGTATVQIRAWDTTTAATWEVAQSAVGGIWGMSNLSDVQLGPVGGLAGDVGGWSPFQLILNVPEPSSFALMGLGAAALALFRRRR